MQHLNPIYQQLSKQQAKLHAINTRVPCFEPPRLVPKAQEANVARHGMSVYRKPCMLDAARALGAPTTVARVPAVT